MICKWTENNNIAYEVDGVRKVEISGAIATKFFIHDFIKNVRDSKKKYMVTVFDDIALEDGDSVRLLDFDHLVTSMDPKSKKFMQFMSATVEILKKGTFKPKTPIVNNPYEE